jgi:hypothetical protein
VTEAAIPPGRDTLFEEDDLQQSAGSGRLLFAQAPAASIALAISIIPMALQERPSLNASGTRRISSIVNKLKPQVSRNMANRECCA